MDNRTFLMPEGCDGSQMWNNPIWALVFLSLFRNGWNGNGVDNAQIQTLQDTVNNQQTNALIMDAIKGNAGAINSLSQQLGCSADALTNAVNAVGSQVNSMGYQNQLANCQQTNTIERNFATTNYNMATQCCELKQGAKDNTAAILAKLDAIEDSRKDREINALTAQLASVTARAERQSELAPIMAQLNAIKCAQPQTVTLPYSCATAVPTAAVYGAYGVNNNGYWG